MTRHLVDLPSETKTSSSTEQALEKVDLSNNGCSNNSHQPYTATSNRQKMARFRQQSTHITVSKLQSDRRIETQLN